VSDHELPPPPTDDDAPFGVVDRSLPKRRTEKQQQAQDERELVALLDKLDKTKDGNVKATPGNATTILAGDSRWQGVLGYDKRSENAVLLKPMPLDDQAPHLLQVPRSLIDGDDWRVSQWFGYRWGLNIHPNVVHGALNAVAEQNPFDRVREYLESLQWDGKRRIATWLNDYMGVRRTDYADAVGRRFLIGCVARALQPGCKLDTVLILEGEQGLKKSTAIRTLAGADYFGDNIPPLASKDAQQYLGGLWVVELAEWTKAETNNLKRFITTQRDRYRPPYGKRMIEHERACAFMATLNPVGGYLNDPTGARRFWPVEVVDPIDLEALAAARDQLWAEAVRCFRAGDPWHFDRAEELELGITEEQAKRQEEDVWEKKVREYLLKNATSNKIETADVLTFGIGMDVKDQNIGHSRRVGGILRSLGWDYVGGGTDGRYWKRK